MQLDVLRKRCAGWEQQARRTFDLHAPSLTSCLPVRDPSLTAAYSLLSFARCVQVIDLKFELQSLKDTTKENEERERRSQKALVRQELEEDFCEETSRASETDTSSSSSSSTSPDSSPKAAANTDLIYYKVRITWR